MEEYDPTLQVLWSHTTMIVFIIICHQVGSNPIDIPTAGSTPRPVTTTPMLSGRDFVRELYSYGPRVHHVQASPAGPAAPAAPWHSFFSGLWGGLLPCELPFV
jgi:hypothetical protein